MAEIHVKRTHGLTQEAAKKSVQSVADKLKDELGARCQWVGDSLRFECPGAEGNIDVSATEVSVAVKLSWMLSAMRGKIQSSIESYLDQYLGR